MELLKFTVRNQSLSGGRNRIVSDSIDYVEAVFDFRTSDWRGLSKWAHFSKGKEVYDVNLADDRITKDMHLNLGAGTWEVKLHGTDPGGTMRITTDRAHVVVESYGRLEDGAPLPEVPLSAAEQIDAKAQEALNAVNSLKEEMEAGDFAPVKGVDYWTEEDKAEIVAETVEAIKAGEDIKGLTAQQIAALDTMFRVCAFIKEDVSGEYTQFREAFGLDEKEEEEHSHSYTSSVTTAAGCTSSGTRTYTCSCGSSYTEIIPAAGHSYVNGVCSVCGEEEPGEDEPVTLESISASYSGGEVPAGTSVNDLAGITVAATYSDGSTEIVTGYTISGTVAEGSNTITVSYSGKTATFTVTGIAESAGEEEDVSNETKWTSGVPYSYTTVKNEYVDGEKIITYNGWDRTPYLYCEGASVLRFMMMLTSSSVSGINEGYNAFYDGNKNYIGSLNWAGVDGNTEGSYKDVEIPEGAVYFIVSHKYNVVSGDTNGYGRPYIDIIPYE